MPRSQLRRPAQLRARWFVLFAITRASAACIAPLLLMLQQFSPREQLLGLIALGYGAATIFAVAKSPRLHEAASAWIVDVLAVLALVVASGQWRSPFYLLALTALILPATALAPRRALVFGTGFVGAYFVVALIVGVDWNAVATTPRLETFVTHLLVPLLVTVSLAYAAELLRTLERERQRSERLALEAERQRIAWDLHDSAKQRIHAAHLVLSAIPVNGSARGANDVDESPVELALRELSAAAGDMDTSLRDLREPLLEGASLGEALCESANRLGHGGRARIEVLGEAPTLPAFVAAHAYLIGREALTNAVRHAEAGNVEVLLSVTDGRLHLVVADDGRGLPDRVRPGANGLRSMRNRAEALGGELRITGGQEGRGTVVALHAPLGRAS